MKYLVALLTLGACTSDPKLDLTYLQPVNIVGGFYRGCSGSVRGAPYSGDDEYLIRASCHDRAEWRWISRKDLEPISGSK